MPTIPRPATRSVAAVLLAVELLLFEWRPRSFLPVALACAVAGFARALCFGTEPLFPLTTAAPSASALLVCLLAGLLSGALASGLSAALYRTEDAFGRLPLHWMWWPALGGVAVGIGGWLEPRALGVGYDVIGDLLHGHLALHIVLAILAVKAVIWVVALGSGTSSGVLAPLLMLGAGLGALLPGGDPALWPLVCMAATLGAPLTAVVFAFGLTHDATALLPLLAATLVAHGFSAVVMRRSIMTEKIARRGYHIYREYGVDPLERHAVADVMTRETITIDAAMPLAEVRRAYFGADQRHRAYPVVRDGAFVTMLERAALERLAAEHGPQARLGDALHGVSRGAHATPHETCRLVATRLAVHGLERLPVIVGEASPRLVGLVSRSDLVKPALRHFDEEHKRERFHGIRVPGARRAQRRIARTG